MTSWLTMSHDDKRAFVQSNSGLSASKIAALVKDASRNAIIGFCHRNRIPLGAKATPTSPTTAKSKAASHFKPFNPAEKKKTAAPKAPKSPKAAKPDLKLVKPEPKTPEPEIGEEEVVEETVEPEVRGPVDILHLTPTTCRWPLNHSYKGLNAEEMMFCGKRAIKLEHYCEECAKKIVGKPYKARETTEVQKKPSVRLWRA